MVQQGLRWQELLDTIARRIREPEIAVAGSQTTAEEQTPYYDLDEMERMLYRVSLIKLRALPLDELEASDQNFVFTEVSVIDQTATVAQNAYAIAGATIQTSVSGPFVMAEFISPIQYLQMTTVDADTQAVYTVMNGQFKFKGNRLKLVLRVEPALIFFQDDEVILPADQNESQIDEVHKLMLAQDFMPTGRM
jgi:hypothetical protein